jgi:ABC-type branched-subunit amino acid transport system ATPase component
MNADILLSAQDLSVRFGGVLAVNKVSFDVKRGEVFTLIGPNGAGKTTVFNLISRIYTPTTGVIDYAGPQGTLRLTDQQPHQIAQLGIARTFQNIELFEHATVLQNLLIGRHTHRKTGVWSEMFFSAKTRAAEIEAAGLAAGAVLEGGVAEAVVGGALLLVLEDVVGFADFLELRFRLGVAGVAVRVVLHGELAVRLLEVVGAGVAGGAQCAVVVGLGHAQPSVRR